MGWRLVAALSALWVLLPLVLMWRWARESPLWLVEQGRIRDAAASLRHFAGDGPADVTTDAARVSLTVRKTLSF